MNPTKHTVLYVPTVAEKVKQLWIKWPLAAWTQHRERKKVRIPSPTGLGQASLLCPFNHVALRKAESHQRGLEIPLCAWAPRGSQDKDGIIVGRRLDASTCLV